jgi:glycosyltransferase involved in cell wall biosynthesis
MFIYELRIMRVSVLTPTRNRREIFPIAVACIRNQIFLNDPENVIEWVIVEDGDEDVQTLLTDLPHNVEVRYQRMDGNHTIGNKRNVCLDLATGDILFFHDDDDYYYPTHIEHGVRMLSTQKMFGVAGSPQLFVYSSRTGLVYRKGIIGNHSPCGVLCFTKKAVSFYNLRFRERDTFGEEKYFLKNFRVPLLFLNPRLTMIAVSHGKNTAPVLFNDDEVVPDFIVPDEISKIKSNECVKKE